MKLTDIILEFKPTYEVTRLSITYIDQNGRFYGLYLYGPKSEDNPYDNWKDKLDYREAVDYVKRETGLDLPDSYDWGSETPLEKIKLAFIKKGIKADYNDAMDVS